MSAESEQFHEPSAIRQYVSHTLCARDQLEASQYTLYEQILMRQGVPCGVCFYLFGPRALCLTAVWETDSNTILFYGSRGERFQKTQLAAAPRLDGFRSPSG